MRRCRFIFLVIGLVQFGLICSAQDVQSSIDAFNAVIGKEYIASNKGKILIIDGFREGKHLKQDKVNVFDLDVETLGFSAVDNTVSVNCYSDLDGCVDQVLLLDKKKSIRVRLVFGLSEKNSGEEVVDKLRSVLEEMAKKY